MCCRRCCPCDCQELCIFLNICQLAGRKGWAAWLLSLILSLEGRDPVFGKLAKPQLRSSFHHVLSNTTLSRNLISSKQECCKAGLNQLARRCVAACVSGVGKGAVYGVWWLCRLIAADLPARHARDIRSRPDTRLNTNKNLLLIIGVAVSTVLTSRKQRKRKAQSKRVLQFINQLSCV